MKAHSYLVSLRPLKQSDNKTFQPRRSLYYQFLPYCVLSGAYMHLVLNNAVAVHAFATLEDWAALSWQADKNK